MNIKKLTSIAECAKNRSIISLFSKCTNQVDRASDCALSTSHIFLDYSKQNINDSELALLVDIAKGSGLSTSISEQFSGVKINNTEGRSVLHTVLRAPKISSNRY